MEIIDADDTGLERLDNFRPDYRIPEKIRPDLVDYSGSGYDRGHLVASANQRQTDLQNSETFLLSNMSPQAPEFNRRTWRQLESDIRKLNDKALVLETSPIFYFDQPVVCIGNTEDGNDVSIPVPNAYFKSVLTEDRKGKLHMWSFVLPNKPLQAELSEFQVATSKVEKLAGIKLWQTLVGAKIEREKNRIRKHFGS